MYILKRQVIYSIIMYRKLDKFKYSGRAQILFL